MFIQPSQETIRRVLDLSTELEPVRKLKKDAREAAKRMSPDEVRFLVDCYYAQQKNRIRAQNQIRALDESEEPHDLITWTYNQMHTVEKETLRMLDAYSDSRPIGRWAKSIHGIGPVISSALDAHIDIEKALYAGQIWNYAGINPKQEWKKGQKRPWNSALKVLCWKIGECFVKVSGSDKDFYGKIYKKRKEYEIQKNEAGEFSEQAAEKLEKFNIDKKTEAYKAYIKGKLPKAHIHERAKRIAVKLFLSHWHEMAYRYHFKREPPVPYAIAILGHAEYIPPPNQDIE